MGLRADRCADPRGGGGLRKIVRGGERAGEKNPGLYCTTLALGNFRCFSLISTKFAVAIAIASSYRFKCKSHTGSSRVCPMVGKSKILFSTEKCILIKWCVQNFSYQLQTGFNRIL